MSDHLLGCMSACLYAVLIYILAYTLLGIYWWLSIFPADEAKQYAEVKGLSKCPHGAAEAPSEYGVQYIPHKVLIGKDGKIIKNYEGFQWSDIDAAL